MREHRADHGQRRAAVDRIRERLHGRLADLEATAERGIAADFPG